MQFQADPSIEIQSSVQPQVDAAHLGHQGSASPNLSGKGVVLAWLSSIAVHALGFVAMFLIVFPYVAQPSAPAPPAFARIIGDIDAVGHGLVDPPNPPGVENAIPTTGPSSGTGGPLLAPDPSRISQAGEQLGGGDGGNGGEESNGRLSILGAGAGIGWGIGTGKGEGPGKGLDLGGGSGPAFFGLQAAAPGMRSIVYVVDRSGSMVSTFSAVRAELKRSIGALRRSQKFHVLFFNSGDPVENPPLRPVHAVEAHKREFFDFLESITPGGGTRPEQAMRRALALEPDLIYFLSDGVFEREFLERLNEWNRSRRTKIYTIAYLDPTGRQLLEAIAREHGGQFKYVSEDNLP